MIENPIPWPDGMRCAVAFTFDMDGESLLHIYQGETAPNRIALTSMLRYVSSLSFSTRMKIPNQTSSSAGSASSSGSPRSYPRSSALARVRMSEIWTR
jgi:hypothetical protein